MKFQIPNSKSPNKFQGSRKKIPNSSALSARSVLFGFSNLVFEVCLGFGAWDFPDLQWPKKEARTFKPGPFSVLLRDRRQPTGGLCCRAAFAAAYTAGIAPAEAATAAHTYSHNRSRITSISEGQRLWTCIGPRQRALAMPSRREYSPPGSFSRQRLAGNAAPFQIRI